MSEPFESAGVIDGEAIVSRAASTWLPTSWANPPFASGRLATSTANPLETTWPVSLTEAAI